MSKARSDAETLVPEAAHDLPPSCKAVYLALGDIDSPTLKAIADGIPMPKRTVRYALQRLSDEGLVTSRCYVDGDARQDIYERVDTS